MLVALYARVSTVRQAENDLSIPDQVQQIQDWCQQRGHTLVRQYIEPGASATDDKRPVFQQMMADAMAKPPGFEAIVIHSLSRFFRDVVEFGVHERRLGKSGVKIISITQQTSDDPMGEMARRLFSLFDEYQSKENAKHTSRAMRENARQGYFNGSRAPFGYQAVATSVTGSRGRKKKKLEIDPGEALIVRKIYDLYLNGLEGRTVGMKEIAMHLNERNFLMRGHPWQMQKIKVLLSDRLYIGEHYFNIRDSRELKNRPPSEWIKVDVPAIIEADFFERVRIKRESRSPAKTPPARLCAPTLLTGFLKCECGASMSVSTGKSGRYRYYKCTRRQRMGNQTCKSRNIPVDLLDKLVLDRLAEQVFTPLRLGKMLEELRRSYRLSRASEQEKLAALQKQIKQTDDRISRLYEAVETGVLPLDETTQNRAQQLKTTREALQIEMANVKSSFNLPMERILPSDVDVFSRFIRGKLLDGSAFAKSYLQMLVDEIRVTGQEATIKGRYDQLIAAIQNQKNKKGTTEVVPSVGYDWRARQESNL